MDKALDLRIRGREFESRYGQEFFIHFSTYQLFMLALIYKITQNTLHCIRRWHYAVKLMLDVRSNRNEYRVMLDVRMSNALSGRIVY